MSKSKEDCSLQRKQRCISHLGRENASGKHEGCSGLSDREENEEDNFRSKRDSSQAVLMTYRKMVEVKSTTPGSSVKIGIRRI